MNPKRITETETLDRVDEINVGGYLERKRGRVCLRLGDAVQMIKSGKYKVTRTWQRPGKHPFDKDIYGSRPVRIEVSLIGPESERESVLKLFTK